jgi:hypothetical protein
LLAKGQSRLAIEHFRWVREHGPPPFVQYTIALSELDRAGISDSPKKAPTMTHQATRLALIGAKPVAD